MYGSGTQLGYRTGTVATASKDIYVLEQPMMTNLVELGHAQKWVRLSIRKHNRRSDHLAWHHDMYMITRVIS